MAKLTPGLIALVVIMVIVVLVAIIVPSVLLTGPEKKDINSQYITATSSDNKPYCMAMMQFTDQNANSKSQAWAQTVQCSGVNPLNVPPQSWLYNTDTTNGGKAPPKWSYNSSTNKISLDGTTGPAMYLTWNSDSTMKNYITVEQETTANSNNQKVSFNSDGSFYFTASAVKNLSGLTSLNVGYSHVGALTADQVAALKAVSVPVVSSWKFSKTLPAVPAPASSARSRRH